jgi:hypothetical protein
MALRGHFLCRILHKLEMREELYSSRQKILMSLSQFPKTLSCRKEFHKQLLYRVSWKSDKILATIRQTDRRPEERMFSPHKAYFPGRKKCQKTNQSYISTP